MVGGHVARWSCAAAPTPGPPLAGRGGRRRPLGADAPLRLRPARGDRPRPPSLARGRILAACRTCSSPRTTPTSAMPLLRALGREGYDVTPRDRRSATALAGALSGTPTSSCSTSGCPAWTASTCAARCAARGSALPVLVLTARTDVARPRRRARRRCRRLRGQALPARGVPGARPRAAAARPGGRARRPCSRSARPAHRHRRAPRPRRRARRCALTPKEYELLVAAAAASGRGRRARGRSCARCGAPSGSGATKTLDMHVSTLRRKLGRAGARHHDRARRRASALEREG